MIILDASVLIAHLDTQDAHHDRAEQLLLASALERLAASPITLAEVFVGPARAGRLDEAVAAVSRLELVLVAVAEDAPLQLARLRAASGLKLPDCCVLLAAEQSLGEVATFDHLLARAAKNLGLLTRTG